MSSSLQHRLVEDAKNTDDLLAAVADRPQSVDGSVCVTWREYRAMRRGFIDVVLAHAIAGQDLELCGTHELQDVVAMGEVFS